jgi:hypothetical protein
MTITRGLVIGTVAEEEEEEADQDWLARSTAAGVLKAFKFTSAAELGEDWVISAGEGSSTGHGYRNGAAIDTATFIPGSTSSLRLRFLTNTIEGECGRWDTHFGGALSSGYQTSGGASNPEANAVFVGENGEVWVQFRVRWNAAMVEQVVPQNYGTKVGDLGDGSNNPSLVMQSISFSTNSNLQIYTGGAGATLEEVRDGNFFRQNATAPYCSYTSGWSGGACWGLQADTWATMTMQVQIGAKRDATHWDMHVNLWGKHYGEAPVQLLNYDGLSSPPTPGYNDYWPGGMPCDFFPNGFWKFILFAFTTEKCKGLRPTSDTVNTSNFTGGWDEINATAPDVGLFAYGANGTAAVLEVELEDVIANSRPSPKNPAYVSSSYYHAKTNAGAIDGSGAAVTVTCQIYEGTTLIASDSAQSCTGTMTERRWISDCSAVTNWNNVRMRFTQSNSVSRGAAIFYGVLGGVHDTADANYDELIISTQEIAQPLDYPAWRIGKTVGEVYEIDNTANMGDPTFATFSFQQQDELIDAYCGNVMDQTNSRWLIVSGGGHAQTCSNGYTNAVVEMDFLADEPVWEYIDEGTVLADITPNRYMLDGRPAARHTYNKGIYIAPGQMADGKERCGMVSGASGLAQDWDATLHLTCSWTDDGTGTWTLGAGFELFRMDPDDWFAHNEGQSPPLFNGSVHGWELQSDSRDAPQYNPNAGGDPYGMPGQDPRTGDIYWVGSSSGYRRLFKWTALTDTWSGVLVDQLTTPDFVGSNASQTFVDTIRNRLVILFAGVTNGSGGADRLVFVDLDTSHSPSYAVTTLTLPAQGESWYGPARQIVHDTDNDLYCFIRHEGSPDGNNMYVYRLYGMSPTTGAITDLSGALPQEMEQGLGMHIGFIPDLHCLVWMTDRTHSIRFMPTL